MNLELINPHVLRILISAREEDSINALSKRISLSYGWTYQWVHKLAKFGVFDLTRMNIYLDRDNEFYRETLNYVRNVLNNDVQFYYDALSLFGISYCFTQTDAVFVWTKGGYNIARYKDFYPVFIKVKNKDRELFERYCNKLNLQLNKGTVFYQVSYLDDFDVEFCDGIPVDPLDGTITFMQKNKYNFEPALEMIKEIYRKRIQAKYREDVTNV